MRKLLCSLLIGVIALFSLITLIAQDNTMHLRAAHFSADAPAVDVYVNGEIAISGLEYTNFSDWLEIDAGNYIIAVAPAGTSIEEAVIIPQIYDLVAGTWVTIAAVGSAEAGTIAPNVLIENHQPVAPDFARLSVTHALADAPDVDVIVNGETVITELAYPGTQGRNDGFYILDIPAGIVNVDVVLTADPETVVMSQSNLELEAGMSYLLAILGTVDDPQLISDTAELDFEEAPTDAPTATQQSEPTATQEIVVTDEPTPTQEIVPTSTPTDEPTPTQEVIATDEPTPTATDEPTATSTLTPTDEPTATSTLTPTDEPTPTQEIRPTETVVAEAIVESTEEVMSTEAPTDEPTPAVEMTEEVMDAQTAPDEEMTEEAMSDDDMMDAEVTPEMEMTEEVMDAEATPEMEMTEEMMSNTIADVVITSASSDEPQFTILLAAIEAADPAILEMLSDPEAELTVFAPTDDAFAERLESLQMTADELLADTDLLTTILQYHVLDGAVMAETVVTMDGQSVPTMLGEDATISISIDGDIVVLNDTINVIVTDFEADNGVIHVIDGVLLPADG